MGETVPVPGERGKPTVWRGALGGLLAVATALLAGCQGARPVDPFGQDNYFFAGKIRLHFVAVGKGQAVLLLHDVGTWSYSWRQIIPALTERYNVLAVDLPGCGLSDKPSAADESFGLSVLTDNLAALVNSTGARDAVVVGHGWGGNVALALAARHPKRVRGLVVTGAWAAADQVEVPLLARVSEMPGIGWLACRWPPGWLIRRHFAPLVGEGSQLITGEWLAQVGIPTHDAGWCEVFRAPEVFSPFSDEEAKALGDVEARALLLWGEEDNLVPVAAGEALAKRLPNARLQVFSGAGHMLHEERPAEFNQAVLTFVDSVSPGRAKRARRRRPRAGPSLPKPEIMADIDRQCPCPSGPGVTSRGARARYRRCVRNAANELRGKGKLTGPEQAALMRRSARSTCGRRNFIRCCRRSRCRVAPLRRCQRLRGKNIGPGSCYPNPCEEEGGS